MSDIVTVNAAQLNEIIEARLVRPVQLECRYRDAFPLTVDVAAWNTGITTKINIRRGTMAAFADAETIDTSNFDTLPQSLAHVNIYPVGDIDLDGDNFRARPLEEFQKWFSERHADPERIDQAALAHLRRLPIEGERFVILSHYMADHMLIFRNPDDPNKFLIENRDMRIGIARSIIPGLASSKRYRRLDPRQAFYKAVMFLERTRIEGTSIIVGGDTQNYAVLRPEGRITPLAYDRAHSKTDLSYGIVSPRMVTGQVSNAVLISRFQP